MNPHQKKHEHKSAAKAMVINFIRLYGYGHQHCPRGSTSKCRVYYVSVVKRLVKYHIPKKRPHRSGEWKLLDDNACPHFANTVPCYTKHIETVHICSTVLTLPQMTFYLPNRQNYAFRDAIFQHMLRL